MLMKLYIKFGQARSSKRSVRHATYLSTRHQFTGIMARYHQEVFELVSCLDSNIVFGLLCLPPNINTKVSRTDTIVLLQELLQ